ncbi:hypothetical protein [Powai lake megavirus]|uniref:Uncharacterized protein n=1 Tax=Powai lake megavirus TaxID=1842663 RepID=A0A167R8T2_9VIRU|nr:hypothetical protein QJ849_gp265 [Powai lake megavirus]ANB50427.1 hypothetical protein [Powai lake megavirus]
MYLSKILPYTTQDCQLKIKNFNYNNSDNTISNMYCPLFLINEMILAFGKKINVTYFEANIDMVKNIFINFDYEINKISGSKFQNDVLNSDLVFSFILDVNGNKIIIHVLCDSKINNIGYISALLHAINTFCHMFPYNYDNLILYICLDQNNRNINGEFNNINQNQQNLTKIFRKLKLTSQAFNVSGVTYRSRKCIILTKNQEIIKLMFHEMIHYIGLDHELTKILAPHTWNIINPGLNLSEAYTEYLSVLLNSAYQSIHLSSVININVYQLYQEFILLETYYSLALSHKIIKFYGYDCNNMDKFFSKNDFSEKLFCPILIWEYVIIRTKLLLNIDKFNWKSSQDLKITFVDISKIIKLTKINDSYIQKIKLCNYLQKNPSFSYNLIDIDWNYI